MTDVAARPGGTAVFLFPSDRLAGAERVTFMLARAAARSGWFDAVQAVDITARETGALDALEVEGVRCAYGPTKRERGGAVWLPLALGGRRYTFAFASHGHINAALSLLRRIGILRTARLVTRESTTIAKRTEPNIDFIRRLYPLYGAQDLVICQTRMMAESLDTLTKRRFGSRVRVFANPIDLDRIAEGKTLPLPAEVMAIPPERVKIAWCGRLAAVKAPTLAVETLARLHARGLFAHLVMIGDGPERAAVLAAAAAHGLSGHLTLTGFLVNPTTVMAACSLGLLTSDIEGFPNVLLEMMASGIRGIAATACADGLDEIPVVRLAPPRDADSLALGLAAVVGSSTYTNAVEHYLAERTPEDFLARAVFGVAA